MTISRVDGSARDFIVPCGPECYRKNSDEALMVGWATARQWLDGGRIPWHAPCRLSPGAQRSDQESSRLTTGHDSSWPTTARAYR